jgi:hypothetical protein
MVSLQTALSSTANISLGVFSLSLLSTFCSEYNSSKQSCPFIHPVTRLGLITGLAGIGTASIVKGLITGLAGIGTASIVKGLIAGLAGIGTASIVKGFSELL